MELAPLLQAIEQAAEEQGLPELARRSGVPYMTLRDWRKAGWRPRAVQVLERLAAATDAANDTGPSAEAA